MVSIDICFWKDIKTVFAKYENCQMLFNLKKKLIESSFNCIGKFLDLISDYQLVLFL